MKDLRDSIKVFEKSDTVVLGVSVDPVSRHKKFCDRYGLPFDLLADTDRSIHKSYQFSRFARSFVLIDKKGVIRYIKKRYRLKKEEWRELLDQVKALPKKD